MRNHAAINVLSKTVSVLNVSPIVEDHSALEEILRQSLRSEGNATATWQLYRSRTVEAGLAILRTRRISVAVCEHDLGPSCWEDLLDRGAQIPGFPPLIVTSKFADEHMWVDALNAGAFDVLAKPFQPDEVTRAITLASRQWQEQNNPSVGTRPRYRAAG